MIYNKTINSWFPQFINFKILLNKVMTVYLYWHRKSNTLRTKSCQSNNPTNHGLRKTLIHWNKLNNFHKKLSKYKMSWMKRIPCLEKRKNLSKSNRWKYSNLCQITHHMSMRVTAQQLAVFTKRSPVIHAINVRSWEEQLLGLIVISVLSESPLLFLSSWRVDKLILCLLNFFSKN